MQSLNVLLVEDSTDYASLVLRWLSSESGQTKFIISWTDTLAAGLARVGQGDIDLVVLDLGLPDAEGLDTFLRMRERAGHLPIVVLSSAESEALALQTIQRGAQDYLDKSTCRPETLQRTLSHTAMRCRAGQPVEAARPEPHRSGIIGVLGGSGGAGATTVACVLAAEFRRQTEEPALLLELDSNPGLVAFTMGIDPAHTVQDAIEWADKLDRSCWDKMVSRHADGLDVLAAGDLLADAETDLPRLRKVLHFARQHYRWIVLDLGRLNRTCRQMLTWCDDLLLVSAQSIPALYQCKHAIGGMEALGVDRERVRLVLNRRREMDPLPRKDIENMFGVPIEATLPPSHDELYNAYLNNRLPDDGSLFRLALSGLVRKMAGLAPVTAKRPLLSLLSIRDRFRSRQELAETPRAS